jgi:hypothetical protein
MAEPTTLCPKIEASGRQEIKAFFLVDTRGIARLALQRSAELLLNVINGFSDTGCAGLKDCGSS